VLIVEALAGLPSLGLATAAMARVTNHRLTNCVTFIVSLPSVTAACSCRSGRP
jgi:hypothetical protein